MPAEQMVHQVKDAGCDAVIVTDHYTPEFFPDNQRNYAQRLHDYFEGYRCAKAEGDRIGLHGLPDLRRHARRAGAHRVPGASVAAGAA